MPSITPALQRVLVLGGTGFIGRHVCEQLVRRGVRVTVPTRRARHAQAVQMLPLVEVVQADVHDPRALAGLVAGHDAVVNLVAVLHGDAARFERVHVTLPRALAQAMAGFGVRRLVHVSALGASEQGPSLYQRSKARGEALLRAAPLDLTLLRPSVVFGAEDRLLNTFAALQAIFPVVPLAGAPTRFQPVWVEDVARAVVACLFDARTIGQTYECTGPEVLTLADLVRLAGRLSGHPRPVIGMPHALAWLQARLMELMPGEPLMSVDNLRSLSVDNVATGQHPGLDELGIRAEAIEPVAARYLDRGGHADPLLAVRERARRG